MSRQPSIIWINIESLRYDHTSLSGYHRDTTPNLKRIAEETGAHSFDRCFSHGHWTAPSCASILTGTYPARHGVGAGFNDAVPASLHTLPELLSAVGYHTAGLTGNGYSGPASGLDRGFDTYTFFRGDDVHRTLGFRTVLKYLLNIYQHGGGPTLNTNFHGTSFMMNEVLTRWTTRFARDEEPFFLWTHYGDPHHPYTPPLMYLDEFTDQLEMSPEAAREFAVYVHENLYELIANGCDFTDDEWAALEAMYDAEIAYTDHCIGKLFDHVTSLVDDVVFVLTGDHGELFGEYGLVSHKLVLTDATTHVPLVTYGLDDVGHRTGDLIQHIDVVKTLVALAGGDLTQLQGVDLRTESREFAVSQHSGTVGNYTTYNPDFDLDRFHTAPLFSLRTDEYRYQESEQRSELFELPNEAVDVSHRYPEVTEQLKTRLAEWKEAYGTLAGTQHADIDEDMQRHLQDMGYLT